MQMLSQNISKGLMMITNGRWTLRVKSRRRETRNWLTKLCQMMKSKLKKVNVSDQSVETSGKPYKFKRMTVSKMLITRSK